MAAERDDAVSPLLVRLSIGLEDPDDLIGDLLIGVAAARMTLRLIDKPFCESPPTAPINRADRLS